MDGKNKIKNAYITLHTACDIKEDDRVVLMRAFDYKETECYISYDSNVISKVIGKICTISKKGKEYYILKYEDYGYACQFNAPFFVLKKVDEKGYLKQLIHSLEYEKQKKLAKSDALYSIIAEIKRWIEINKERIDIIEDKKLEYLAELKKESEEV